jgi:hypothetical protein
MKEEKKWWGIKGMGMGRGLGMGMGMGMGMKYWMGKKQEVP